MPTCDITLPASTNALPLDSSIDVVEKFKKLSEAALDTDSIYMRAKDTFKELLDNRRLNEDEYAQLAATFVSQLAVTTTQQAMQEALQWAKAEQEQAFNMEALKANVELVMAQRERTRLEICKLQKDTELQCANITATLASSIRKNGRVATSDINNPCVPLTLMDEGTEYVQSKAIDAQKYSTLADAYRKSGVVDIATTLDGMTKGTAGDNMGYTDAQEEFARRQVKSFEDSKRNHAANAISQMIGQILSTDTVPAPEYIAQWNTAVGYLNTNTP